MSGAPDALVDFHRSTLSDADVRRVFRSVESEDAVALDALLAFVEA